MRRTDARVLYGFVPRDARAYLDNSASAVVEYHCRWLDQLRGLVLSMVQGIDNWTPSFRRDTEGADHHDAEVWFPPARASGPGYARAMCVPSLEWAVCKPG